MIKLYICCLVLIIGSVEVGPDIDMKFHQEVMEIVSYDISVKQYNENLYQVPLNLSKAVCNCCPTQAKTLASIPKQNILALSLVQHIYRCE